MYLIINCLSQIQNNTKPIADAKSAYSTASTTAASSQKATESAVKKAADLKKSLIATNDKLAEAKRKQYKSNNENLINVLSKSVESTKVQLSEAEKAATFAKNAEVKALKELTVKRSALESAEKSGENAKKALTTA